MVSPIRLSKRVPNLSRLACLTVLLMFLMVPLGSIAEPQTDGPPGDPGTVEAADVGEASGVEAPVELPMGMGSGCFIRNDGQLDRDDVLYYSQGAVPVALTKEGVLMDIKDPRSYGPSEGRGPEDPFDTECELAASSSRGVVVGMSFQSGNEVAPVGMDPMPHYYNFFYGNDPEGWVTEVPCFDRVVYEDVWEGVDVEYLFTDEGLKYNVYVGPGGDLAAVRFEYEGIDGLRVDARGLVLSTAVGDLVDSRLLIYQEVDGVTTDVPGSYELLQGHGYSFRVGKAYREDVTLVIDPVLLFGTYLGGTLNDLPRCLAVDSAGDIYVGGHTFSTGLGTTGAYQKNRPGTGLEWSVFVAKLNALGDRLDWYTYLGGDEADRVFALEVDDAGNSYVTGYTYSNNLPVTSNAIQSSGSKSGYRDSYVLKIDPNGSSLLYGSYLAGNRNDHGMGVAVNDKGEIIVAGYTYSTDFLNTSGSYDTGHNGNGDCFVLKISSNGTDLVFGTFIGGSRLDLCYDMVIDGDDNVLLVGETNSWRYPTTPSAWQKSPGGINCVFVTKLNSSGSFLEFSTYFGGEGGGFGGWGDIPLDMKIDVDGNIVFAGITYSDSLPTSATAFQTSRKSGAEAFIATLKPDGSDVLHCTYLGGLDDEYNPSFAFDSQGNIVVAGDTKSTTVGGFPVTDGSYKTYNSGERDIFVSKLTSNLTTLLYSTFVGNVDNEDAMAVCVDSKDCAIVLGQTPWWGGFPTTEGAFRENPLGDIDCVVFRIDVSFPTVVADHTSATGTTSTPFEFALEVEDNIGIDTVQVEYRLSGGGRQTEDMTNPSPNPALFNMTLLDTPYDFTNITYRFIFTDTGNVNTTSNLTVPITDDTKPSLFDALAPAEVGTGEVVTFMVNATDNIGMSGVYIEYWFGNGEHVNISMDGDGPFGSAVDVPLDSVAPLYYIFSVNDTSDNWQSMPGTVTVIDVISPTFDWQTDELSPGDVTTGDPFSFMMRVGDNIGISTVSVIYWQGDDEGTGTNATMVPQEVDAAGVGKYTYSGLTLADDTLDQLHWRYYFEDLEGNGVVTRKFDRIVRDNDPPVIVADNSDPRPTTGDTFRVEVEVMDLLGVDQVLICYWLGDQKPIEMLMTEGTVSGEGHVTYYFTIEIVDFQTGVLHYYLTVVDNSVNKLVTERMDLDVVDDDAPIITNDISDTEATLGMDINIAFLTSDNLGVTSGYVQVYGGGVMVDNVTLTEVEGRWTVTYTVPRDIGTELVYMACFLDAAGNLFSSEGRTVPLGNIAPEIGVVPTWEVTEGVDAELDLTPYLSDGNDPVNSLTLSVDLADVVVEGQVLKTSSDVWMANQLATVIVSDGTDEVTTRITITYLDVNDPPGTPVIILPAADITVTEGDVVTFEATFGDPDLVEGQVLQITWTSDIEGLISSATSANAGQVTVTDLAVGVHTITLTVFDGEHDATATVEVTVEKKAASDDGEVFYKTTAGMLMILIVIILVVAVVVFAVTRGRGGISEEEADGKEPQEETVVHDEAEEEPNGDEEPEDVDLDELLEEAEAEIEKDED